MNLLIVESAAKARTLQRYLGDGWKVMATGGHVETLPHNRKAHGKAASKAYWANRPGELPSPPWVPTERGEQALKKILAEAGSGATFWLAPDPDREGEFIAWSLAKNLEDSGPTHRVSFQEVTKEAVQAALEQPRPVDRAMVESALVRKFLDRLVGYRASKMANSVLSGKGASMGRVQTPTLGFVVDRELEREAHVPIPYFEVDVDAQGVNLSVRFHEPDDEVAWRDEDGKVNPSRTFDQELAEQAAEALRDAGKVRITGAKRGTRRRRPSPPFSTDALLQAAGSRFGWSPRKTSALASRLYEAGHVTYIRTDSTRLAGSAIKQVRGVIAQSFGEDHLGSGARTKTAAGPVQDAHEAIRPTRADVEEPALDDDDARKLYRLIRARTLASQMAPSVRSVVSIEAACAGFERPLTGSVSWRTFAGWEAAVAEFRKPVATTPPDVPLEENAVWELDPPTDERENPRLVEDETRPPPRYSRHMLIKAMKDAGIGRPSTYSRTVEKLEERGYLEVEDRSLVPTERGRIVWTEVAPLYSEQADGEGPVELFSTEFTALMEDRLDGIARGEIPAPESWEEWRDQIRELHAAAQKQKASGVATPAQKKQLEALLKNAPEEVSPPADLETLSYDDAKNLIRELREAGVSPAPTKPQLKYLRQLVTDLALTDDELEEYTRVRDIEEIRDSDQASAAIDALKRIYDERKPPSEKQRRFIADLVAESKLSEKEAAGLVGANSLEELTGGSKGSASALIDKLQQRSA